MTGSEYPISQEEGTILYTGILFFSMISLKVVSGHKNWESRVVSIASYWYGTVALGITKIRNFAIAFKSVHFRFRPVLHGNS